MGAAASTVEAAHLLAEEAAAFMVVAAVAEAPTAVGAAVIANP